MIIRINGKEETLRENILLSDFIKNKKLDSHIIVAEHNRKIVLKENFDKIILKDQDRLEILTFVGGG